MDREISEVYKLAIDLILTATVLGIVISFAFVSHTAFSLKNQQDSTNINIQKYSELYEYDNKIVNGSDVVDIILLYTRVYDFEIKDGPNDKNPIKFDRIAEEDTGLGLMLWERKNIVDTLGGDIGSDFKSKINFDDTGTYVIGITFTKEG